MLYDNADFLLFYNYLMHSMQAGSMKYLYENNLWFLSYMKEYCPVTAAQLFIFIMSSHMLLSHKNITKIVQSFEKRSRIESG